MTPRNLLAQARIDSPLGPMTLAASAEGLAGLWFDGQKHHPGALEAPHDAAQVFIAQARAELARYWQDGTRRFEVRLAPQGTPFQQAVWQALLTIPFGQTTSYGTLATRIGRPKAVRALGAAVGRNPIGIIVPCHRVIGADGSLTGYAGGLDRKTALLRIEGVL